MRRLFLVSVVVLAACGMATLASGASATSPRRWVVRDLGTLGGPESVASALNERGEVVGESEIRRRGSASHAFLWSDGKMRDLGTLGGVSSAAVAINENGTVVGWSDTSKGARHAFIWRDGKMTDLGTLGGQRSEAVAINSRDQIVGWSERKHGGDLGYHAFLWQNGKMRDLGTLGGGQSGAVGINDLGQVVGNSTGGKDYYNEAFLWQRGRIRDLGFAYAAAINIRGQVLGASRLWDNGRLTRLTAPAGDSVVRALALNNKGDAAGICARWEKLPWVSDAARPCVWVKGKGRDLGILRHGTRGRALDINDRTEVVGRTAIGPPSGKSHAFIWTNGKMTDLGGLRRTDWSVALAITNNGLILGNSQATTLSPFHAVLWVLSTT